MQNVNINRLKGKIVERGMSIATLAEALEIDRSTLYRKLENDGAGLLVRDANKIATVLDLTRDEAVSIFFARYVA